MSVLQSDMEFLKYLINDKKVDVSGEHMKFCGLYVIVEMYKRLGSITVAGWLCLKAGLTKGVRL